MRELFDEDFPVWTSPQEPARAARRAARRRASAATALAKRYRSEVLRHHTYDHRARPPDRGPARARGRSSPSASRSAPPTGSRPSAGATSTSRARCSASCAARGHRCLIQVLDEWEDDEGLHLRRGVVIQGPQPPPPEARAAQRALEHQPPGRRHRRGVRRLRPRLRRLGAVRRRPCASGPRRRSSCSSRRPTRASSTPTPRPSYEHDLVYVANSRSVLRPIVRDLLPTDARPGRLRRKLGGADRHSLRRRRARPQRRAAPGLLLGQDRPLRPLGRHARARLHLEPDLRRAGLRGDVVSDEVAGLEERFGDAVVTYRDPDDLRGQIERLLAGERDKLLDRSGRELCRTSRATALGCRGAERFLCASPPRGLHHRSRFTCSPGTSTGSWATWSTLS